VKKRKQAKNQPAKKKDKHRLQADAPEFPSPLSAPFPPFLLIAIQPTRKKKTSLCKHKNTAKAKAKKVCACMNACMWYCYRARSRASSPRSFGIMLWRWCYRMMQQPVFFSLSKVVRAARVAASNTSSTPSPVRELHSRYFFAPTCLAIFSP
jgi:hypothetical protein